MSTLTDHGDIEAGKALHAAFPDSSQSPEEWRGDVTVQVDPAAEVAVVTYARDQLGYDLFLDRLGADRGEEAELRFDVITLLYNTKTDKRLHLRTTLPAAGPELPTLRDVYRGADWFEREVFDMYGVRFTGHPGLKRILMADDFPDFPLRKEYPVEGKGEFAAPRRALGGTQDGTDGSVSVNFIPSEASGASDVGGGAGS